MRKLFLSLSFFALSSFASAKTCNLEIEGNDMMQFNKKELTVEADCTDVKLTLKHVGKLARNVMGHNWLLIRKADLAAASTAALQAGAAKDYTPEDSKMILAKTKLLAGGESDEITFSLKGLDSKESYSFFCSFPGHFALMQGAFIIKPKAAKNVASKTKAAPVKAKAAPAK